MKVKTIQIVQFSGHCDKTKIKDVDWQTSEHIPPLQI